MRKRNEIQKAKTHRMVKTRLWWYRKKIGCSQQVVAQLLGHKSAARVSDYERSKRIPSFETALKLSIILQTPIPLLYPDLYAKIKHDLSQRGKAIGFPSALIDEKNVTR